MQEGGNIMLVTYMLGYSYCEQVALSVPADEPVKPP